jgi:hypothetical protein
MMTPQQRREDAGKRAEKKVNDVLSRIRNRGEIRNYKWHRKFSREDLEGKDFTISLLNGKQVFLQVKSRVYLDDIKRLHLERKQGVYQRDRIFTIEARPEETNKEVEKKIKKILELKGG